MQDRYHLKCDCGAIEFELSGVPRVQAFCHCEDCRELQDVPYHSVTAWDSASLRILRGEAHARVFQHPRLAMTRVFCRECGETIYNTNAMGWSLVSQLLISKCNGGELPQALRSSAHDFYDRRIVEIDDSIPKG